MESSQLIDFLVRNRRWIVALIVALVAAFASWLAARLARRAGPSSVDWKSLIGDLVLPQLAPYASLTVGVRDSSSGGSGQITAALHALISACLERARAFWKPLSAIVLSAIVLIGGFLWWYDRNEKELVVTGLNLPPSPCKPEHREGIVIFIHGWSGDARETWKRYPELMCGDKRFAAFEVVSVGYPTLMKSRGLNVSQIADWIREQLRDQLRVTDGEKLVFVAHSMGGLIAREITLLQRLGQSPGTIAMLAEIGTPHNGAQIAPLATALGLSKDLTGDMLEGSSTLRGLQVRWNALAPRPETICYSSPGDNVVRETSAFYQCDYQLSFPVWSHTDLVKPESRQDPRYQLPTQEIARRLGLH